MTDGDEGALASFEQLHAQRPGDELVRFQLTRLRSGQRGEHIVMTDK
jgi:adenylate cyclase